MCNPKPAKRCARPALPPLIEALPVAVSDARIEALNEAADHLELEWTDDRTERAQGNVVIAYLRAAAAQINLLAK